MKYLLWKPLMLLLMASLICSLMGCAQNTAPARATPTTRPSLTPSPPVQHTASPTVVAGTVLYTADWSHGLANWHGSQGWSIVQGQLQVNSLAETTLTIPYKPTVPNYAIEIRAQVLQVLKPIANGFTLIVNPTPQGDGFEAGFTTLNHYQPAEQPDPNFYTGYIQIIPDNLSEGLQIFQLDYVPGTIWHTYGIEVQGNEADLSLDGHKTIRSTSSENAFSNGPFVLDSQGLLLRVSSIRFTAL